LAISGHFMQCGIMSAFGGKADIAGPSKSIDMKGNRDETR
jgi:hypothetical protein